MIRLGVVEKVVQIRQAQTYNEYRVYLDKGTSRYTRWDGVLRLKEGQTLYITRSGKWLVEV